MTPEGKVKVWAKLILRAELPGAVIYSPPGGAFGRAGEPDIHITYGGCKMVIEAKSDVGEPTKLQIKRLMEYRAAGALAMIMTGKDEGRLRLGIKLLRERAECLKTIIGLQNQA